ncbi:MAG: tRNA (guanosine(37)-N1)-methyltransferase TrmD [Rhizobiales bacterium NRL2]|jgi:tRNA (guanine37-N1)-methyltransferase|nr:MAG: tRNA (guanosine(37)-N1)-methyltransferase TrmD [Rhizobiales bacterium NRL2]
MSGPAFGATVLTLYPEVFPGPLGVALAGKALEAGIWTLKTVDIRGFAHDKHRSVDDAPFGGGAGMVMRPDVLAAAIDASHAAGGPLIYFSPRGRRLDQELVGTVREAGSATLICGRFEGVDQRVLDARGVMEVSLGDFVLSGGEYAALALMDAVVRLLPGVAGNADSLAEESFADGLLEYPHYTRPRDWEGMTPPGILLSGDHARIRAWRKAESERLTRERRPDLWRRYTNEEG